VRELHLQHAPPPSHESIRCWCEWIFDAMFAYNEQLSSILFCTDVVVCMTGRFNIYSQLVISATRIADITNCEQMLNRPAIHLVVYNRFCSVPPIPFLCISTNSEVQKRYLPIIRGAERLSLASRCTLTTASDVCPSKCQCQTEQIAVRWCWFTVKQFIFWFLVVHPCFDLYVRISI